MKIIRLFIILSLIRDRPHFRKASMWVFLAAYQLTMAILLIRFFPKKVTNGAIGVTVNYELMPRVMLRGGFTYTIVGGADRFSNDDSLKARNLAFETKIAEFSLMGEYYFFDLAEQRFSPYVFGGLAVFHFNPYAYNGTTQKIYLKPLSTEGEGIPVIPKEIIFPYPICIAIWCRHKIRFY